MQDVTYALEELIIQLTVLVQGNRYVRNVNKAYAKFVGLDIYTQKEIASGQRGGGGVGKRYGCNAVTVQLWRRKCNIAVWPQINVYY